MDLSEQTQNEDIREIEDIIDMQKANGSYRQVAFSLPLPMPSETGSTESAGGAGGVGCAAGAGQARSLESGLSRPARARQASLSTSKKKPKKLRPKRRKSPLPDVISWPSDSDITVLRMQLCRAGAGAGERLQPAPAGDVVRGDGPHRPDGSSIVNLATLVLQSRSPSKRSLNIEEFLLPLTSWEHPPPLDPHRDSPFVASTERKVLAANCSHSPYHPEKLNTEDSEAGVTRASAKSRVARFLRLYFCPCCTCLYDMEKLREEPGEYAAPRPPHPPHPPRAP